MCNKRSLLNCSQLRTNRENEENKLRFQISSASLWLRFGFTSRVSTLAYSADALIDWLLDRCFSNWYWFTSLTTETKFTYLLHCHWLFSNRRLASKRIAMTAFTFSSTTPKPRMSSASQGVLMTHENGRIGIGIPVWPRHTETHRHTGIHSEKRRDTYA